VRSDAAQAFSTSLIAGWRAGLTLSAAKAAAQRSLRQTPGFGHPGLWASFVLLGEGETKWTPGP
jgi:CHAT domain-containing protein